ncbi:MAG: cysteine synthase family protein [Halobacteriales archaeon]
MTAVSTLEAVGTTPLVELEAVRPAGGARILAKWEGANPTGSMKDRMAVAIIRAARERGDLVPGQRVAEYTGGSTGTSLAMVSASLDHPATLITADCFATEKIRTMRAFGADVEVLETPAGQIHPGLIDEWQERIDAVVEETGAYWTDQLHNADALDGYASLGEEILADAPGVTDFVMGVGTGGCAMGTARALRAERDVRVTLLEPAESPILSEGRRGDHNVEGLAVVEQPPLLDDDLFDEVRAVSEAEGRTMARRVVAEEGLFGGISTGLNVAAAAEVAAERDPEDVVTTVACDTGLKYLDGDLFVA